MREGRAVGLAAMGREDLSFHSGGTRCAAWLYRPEGGGEGPAPCVVMAHGFSAVRDMRLPAYAERFADAGMNVLVFDYRHFGDSDGEPRQLIDIGRQLDDWRAAIVCARGLEGVDPDRIALWGSSFSGGHVVRLAAGDDRVAAVVSQAPYTTGLAALRAGGPRHSLLLTAAGLRDLARALTGREPHYVPAVAKPGQEAAMASPEAEPGMLALAGAGSTWENRFAPRVGLRLPAYNPYWHARRVKAPLLVCVGDHDQTTPPGPAIAGARAAPRGRLERYPIGHFQVYLGEWFERAVADQTRFLVEHLAAHAAHASATAAFAPICSKD
jgi:dienelactone hydrolase